MKKKKLIISGIIVILIGIISLILVFINNINNDKKITKENINSINESYNNIKEEVVNYNNLRKDITDIINNFYYDTIEKNYLNNLKVLEDYDSVINKIINYIKILDNKCNIIYNDYETDNICNNYKIDYETIVNVFINDINSYNKKLDLYNKDNSKNLELFKSKHIDDYIDYNGDNIYLEKEEVNE